MSENSEILAKALSTKTDLYALLGLDDRPATPPSDNHDGPAPLTLPPPIPLSDIKRAYRRTALRYHPDKTATLPPAARAAADTTFLALTDALAILSDPAARAAYDSRRAAERARTAEQDRMGRRRKQMVDALTRREQLAREAGGISAADATADRARGEKAGELARQGRQMVEERIKQRQADAAAAAAAAAQPETSPGPSESSPAAAAAAGDYLDRTVRVRWALDGDGKSVTRDQIEAAFARFGPVESVIVLDGAGSDSAKKPRKARLRPDWKHRKPVAGAYVLFESVVAATNAVETVAERERARQDRIRAATGAVLADADADPEADIFVEATWAGKPESRPATEPAPAPAPLDPSSAAPTRPAPSADLAALLSRFAARRATGPAGLAELEQATLIRMRRAGRAQARAQQAQNGGTGAGGDPMVGVEEG